MTVALTRTGRVGRGAVRPGRAAPGLFAVVGSG